MATGWPDYKFVLGNKKPILYIGGYQLLFNRIKVNNDAEKTAYFYCVNKIKHGISCKSSAKAMVIVDEESEEQKFLLSSYSSNHSESCIPNSTHLQVKAVRAAIKEKIIENPTMKPSHVYTAEVDRVRDTLGEGFKEDFDQLMPTKGALNPSIYAWKRTVVPVNPDTADEITTDCPFFLTPGGENICKASINVGGDPRRRILLLTTDKVMSAGVRFSERGVMDATFDVSLIIFSSSIITICFLLVFSTTV